MDIKLRESHQQAVCQADEQTTGVESAYVGCGHHDNIGNPAPDARHPERGFPTQEFGNWPGEKGGEECAQRHERRDQLLPIRLDVPADGRFGVRIPEDLQ